MISGRSTDWCFFGHL